MAQLPNLNPELHINPSPEQANAFLAFDPARPVVYLNLLRYRERALYPADYRNSALPPDVSGREAFHRYLRAFEREFLPQVDARLLFVAPVELLLIGTTRWDEVMLGFYPTQAAGLRLTALPGYDDIGVHRIAALEAAQTLLLEPGTLTRFVAT